MFDIKLMFPFDPFEVYEIDVNEVVRNRLRVAEVWLDEYSALRAEVFDLS